MSLDPNSLAFNHAHDASRLHKRDAVKALEQYNRAAAACEALFPLGDHPELVLVPKKILNRNQERKALR